MKKLIINLTIISIIGCSLSVQNDYSKGKKVDTIIMCDKAVQFGDINICLPLIDGMTDCYSTPIVKERVDQLNYKENSILAYYVNNETYRQLDKFDEINYDDYFQIFGINKLKGKKMGQSELNQTANIIEGNYLKENWKDLKKKIEISHDYISIGRPILIESYSLHKQARTFVMVTKFQIANFENVTLMTMNMVQIKERLICLAYYRDYEGEESVKATKSKNDYIVLNFIDENK